MQYKITAFDPATAQVRLEFEHGFAPITVSLPIDSNGNVPVGPELDFYLRGFIPVWEIERQEALKNGVSNAAAISSLLQPSDIPPPPTIPDPILDATLGEAVSYAQRQIDKAASDARSRFITVGYGQEMTYLVKQAQAQAYVDAGYQGEVPPFIASEAGLRGLSAQAVADEILAVALPWQNVIGPKIEALRLAGKEAVAKQADVQGIDQSMRSTILQLQGITP